MNIYHPHRHHRLIPITILALGIPIILFGGFLFVGNLTVHDEEKPNDAALRLSAVPMPAEKDNALLPLSEMSALYIQSAPEYDQSDNGKIEGILNGGEWDAAAVKKITNIFAPASKKLLEAAERPKYQDGFAADPHIFDYSKMAELTGIQYIARVTAIQAASLAIDGKNIEGGLSQAQHIVRLGQTMESGQNTLLQLLVGSSIKRSGLASLRTIAKHTPLTKTQARSITQTLEGYRDTRPFFTRALKVEYAANYYSWLQFQTPHELLFGIYSMTSADDPQQPRSFSERALATLDEAGVTKYYYFPNQTLRFTMEDFQQTISITTSPCVTMSDGPVDRSRSTTHGAWKFFEPNALGKALRDIGASSLSGLGTLRCNEETSLTATQVAMALSAYAKDHNGNTPTQLSDLVPTYMDVMPNDPYATKPLIYNAMERILYSVGEDHSDNGGGLPNGTLNQAADPTFSF